MSDWFTIRQKMRRDIHAAFSLRASYVDSFLGTPVLDLHVRWHDRFGTPIGIAQAGTVEFDNIDQIVFDTEELTSRGVTVHRGGKVLLTDPDMTFVLGQREPGHGSIDQVWTVSK